jgi:UDP-N-acetylglucosamine 4,6-dehydratase
MKNDFKNKTLLLTGGTGSFGKAFLSKIISDYRDIKKIIIFSRDELKQFNMSQNILKEKFPFIRFFLGDVRDKDRLLFAMQDVDYVIHAAALKQVPTAEYNPFEYIKTNIIGAQNIIECSLRTNVKKVIALSTDKASSPINLYGATKLCSDKLFISANNIVGKKKLAFTVVRYGNVDGSRGSIMPFFLKQKKKGQLTVTDPNMTRFSITLSQSIDLVLKSLSKEFCKGAILVPKIPSYRILDLAKAVDKNIKIKIIGIRPGEKLHEEMISASDSRNTFECKDDFLIFSDLTPKQVKILKKNGYKNVKENFNYNSSTNNHFLSVSELKLKLNKINKAND